MTVKTLFSAVRHASCNEQPAAPEQPVAWVGLTDEEMYEIGEFKNSHGYVTTAFKRVVRAIEAKLRERNGGGV